MGVQSRRFQSPSRQAWWPTRRAVALGLVATLLAPVPAQAEPAADAMLVLDASGSMWGQIDGVNKIVIAKDVVEGMLLGLPAERRLGLIAYGHRRKGDCDDIETLAAVDSDRDVLTTAIRELVPRGKTPLAASIERAAKELRVQERAAEIILVSDGLETCDADPCALARTLAETAVDLEIHVLGFDVTVAERQALSCITAATNGKLLTADSADELIQALSELALPEGTAFAPAQSQAPDVPVVLKATLQADGPLLRKDLHWQLFSETDAATEPLFDSDQQPTPKLTLAAGSYRAQARWHGWRTGEPKGASQRFTVLANQPKVVTVPIPLNLPVELEVPDQTAEGVPFMVRWRGPDDLGAFLYVNALDDSPREAVYGGPAQRARDRYRKGADPAAIDTDGDGVFDQDDFAAIEIGGPSVPGQYEVRYVLDKPRLVLARAPITVTDSTYKLSAPATVPAGTHFEARWSGPATAGDYLAITPEAHAAPTVRGFTSRLKGPGEPVVLRAPSEPGRYEIRYVLANGYTLYPGMQQVVQSAVPVEVTAVSAGITAPTDAVGGSTVTVTLDSLPPESNDDRLSVILAGTSKVNRDSSIRLPASAAAGSPVDVPLPNQPGDYEFAYFQFPGPTVLARAPVRVTQASARVFVPTAGKLGAPIEVQFEGPGYRGDRIVIVPAERPDSTMWSATPAYGFLVREAEGTQTIASKAVPKAAGNYEVRYVTGRQHVVLARAPIRLE